MSTISMPDEFYIVNMTLLSRRAGDAAAALAALEEWAAAGMMLRAAQIIGDRWRPEISHQLGLDALTQCQTREGKAACEAFVSLSKNYVLDLFGAARKHQLDRVASFETKPSI